MIGTLTVPARREDGGVFELVSEVNARSIRGPVRWH